MAATATLANVAASATSVVAFPSVVGDPPTGGPLARTVQNDSAADLYLKFGATASTTSYTVKIPPFGYYEFPQPAYAGVVHGIWSSATGSARTTEVA